MYEIRSYKLGLKLVENRKNCSSSSPDYALSVIVGLGIRKGAWEEGRGIPGDAQTHAGGEVSNSMEMAS